MQAWRRDGQYDGLTGELLHNYLVRTPLACRTCKKTAPPKRWRSWAVVKIGRLLYESAPALRKLLKLDVASEEAKSLHVVAAERAERISSLEAELKEQHAAAQHVQDAWRKAAGRLKKTHGAVTQARREERAKLSAKLSEERKALKPRAREEAEAKVADNIERVNRLRNEANARAREAEKKVRACERKIGRLEKTIEKMEEEDSDEAPESPEPDEPDEPASKISRRDERGRFTGIPWEVRPLIYGQHARRTPPSAINANITQVLKVFAEEKVIPLPALDELRRMRGELTVAGEAMAAMRVALAKRIMSFGFDESTKFGMGLLSSNTQIEEMDGTVTDVVQRGATLTAGGTSDEIAKSIDTKIFSHSRRLLQGWREEHERLYGAGSWGADGGPDPSQIGMHRLSEQTVIMGDTCNAERKAKRIVADLALAAAKDKYGEEALAAMSEAERERVSTSFIGDCHQHLRNILINAMSIAATDMLKDTLEDDLAEFSAFDRMSVDGMQLIRAIYKEMHPGGEYAKGKGREFKAWVEKHFGSAMWVPFANAAGSRQDMALDGALPIFANRKIALEFLHGLVNVPRADNVLEKFLWRLLRCNEITALLRVCTLWKLIVTDPMRWLTGKAAELKDWSLVSASRVLELAEEAFIAVAADGSKLFDLAFSPFTEISQQQALFASWQAEVMALTVKAADGTKHRVYERVLAEARSPEGKGNLQATSMTVALAEKMATAALTAMHDAKRAIADKLSSQDGANAPVKQQKTHEATIGCHVANDRVESNFGSYDYVGHVFRGTSVAHLSGLTQQMHNHDFELPENVAHDRGRKSKADARAPKTGFFYGLSPRLQRSLIEYARKEAPRARKVGKEDLAAHDEAKLARREERVITLLNKAVEDYAYSKELFAAWQADSTKPDKIKVDAQWQAFIKDKPESEVLMFLRKQIEMRVLGLGWSQFATRWSSNADSKIGTVVHLRSLLIEILTHEMTARRMNELPDEAALPQQVQRDLGLLGTVDEDAAEIEMKALFSTEELAAKAEAAMQRRVEAGISDSVEDLNAGVNNGAPPAFDQALVGKRVEVLWPYTDKNTGKRVLIWATGRVARVADGLTHKSSARARTVLPAGMVLWTWEADPEYEEPAGEKWLALQPKKWNKQQLYSWRYDPREFSPAATPTRDERRRNTRMDCEA